MTLTLLTIAWVCVYSYNTYQPWQCANKFAPTAGQAGVLRAIEPLMAEWGEVLKLSTD